MALFVLIGYALIVTGNAGPTPGDTEAIDVVDKLRTGWLTDVAKVVTALGSTRGADPARGDRRRGARPARGGGRSSAVLLAAVVIILIAVPGAQGDRRSARGPPAAW